ncbi:hypothetical protein BJX68DRAFT_87023 [Aspergillus pseudodeflectus]|uniref:Uncharacterized protein n=1 Tax=Aspergillus pseudodeflectus TaxID=176178 RepID=A0ABR4L7I6_9EURO
MLPLFLTYNPNLSFLCPSAFAQRPSLCLPLRPSTHLLLLNITCADQFPIWSPPYQFDRVGVISFHCLFPCNVIIIASTPRTK